MKNEKDETNAKVIRLTLRPQQGKNNVMIDREWESFDLRRNHQQSQRAWI